MDKHTFINDEQLIDLTRLFKQHDVKGARLNYSIKEDDNAITIRKRNPGCEIVDIARISSLPLKSKEDDGYLYSVMHGYSEDGGKTLSKSRDVHDFKLQSYADLHQFMTIIVDKTADRAIPEDLMKRITVSAITQL